MLRAREFRESLARQQRMEAKQATKAPDRFAENPFARSAPQMSRRSGRRRREVGGAPGDSVTSAERQEGCRWRGKGGLFSRQKIKMGKEWEKLVVFREMREKWMTSKSFRMSA